MASPLLQVSSLQERWLIESVTACLDHWMGLCVCMLPKCNAHMRPWCSSPCSQSGGTQ